MSMPIQRQSESFGAFDTGTRWARDRGANDLPSGLAALINTSGPRIQGGMLDTRTAGWHYPEYDPRVDGYPEEDPLKDSYDGEWPDLPPSREDYDDEDEWNGPPPPNDRFVSEDDIPFRDREARRGSGRHPFDRSAVLTASYDDSPRNGTCRWCGEDVRYMPVRPGDAMAGYDYQHEEHPYSDYGHPAEPEGGNFHYEDGPSFHGDPDHDHVYREAAWADDNPDHGDVMRRIDEQLAAGEPEDASDHSTDYHADDGLEPWERELVDAHEQAHYRYHPEYGSHIGAVMQAPVVGAHGFQPAHRVGLPWRDSVIPGTVIGLDGPNVGVRWDDGQYSTEEPHNIRLL